MVTLLLPLTQERGVLTISSSKAENERQRYVSYGDMNNFSSGFLYFFLLRFLLLATQIAEKTITLSRSFTPLFQTEIKFS